MSAFKHNAILAIKTVLAAWLVSGTLDITVACIQYFIKTGKAPEHVLTYIASGYFGTEALSGGFVMAAWGLLFHFLIAFTITLVFFLLYPLLRKYLRSVPVMAIFIGASVWGFMNTVILPLSHTPPLPMTFQSAAIAMSILIVCIGLPVALFLRHYYRKQARPSES